MKNPNNTIVYIDGFNLYYGCCKGTRYKWLDLSLLCNNLLPKHSISEIKYFTAMVSGNKANEKVLRQQLFLRAQETNPNFKIILGHFLTHIVSARAVNPNPDKFVDVYKTEEKGSDVNIATHLLCDAYNKKFDVAVLVTNDSDLVEPVKVVVSELKLKVGIINPHPRHGGDLKKHATFYKNIWKSFLKKSQFPNTLTDSKGKFHKPPGW